MTPGRQWHCCPCHIRSRRSDHQKAGRPHETRRQAAWRTYFDSVARRQIFDVGCYGGQHSCCFLLTFHVSLCRQRCWSRYCQEGIKVLNTSSWPYFSTYCHGDPRSVERICSELPQRGWSSVELCLRTFSRDLISISAPFDYCSALQLSLHYGFLLRHRRRPGPLATSDICFSS